MQNQQMGRKKSQLSGYDNLLYIFGVMGKFIKVLEKKNIEVQRHSEDRLSFSFQQGEVI